MPWTLSATWLRLPNGLSNHPAFELLDKAADLGRKEDGLSMGSETEARAESAALLFPGSASAPYPGLAQCCAFPELLGLEPRPQRVTSYLMKM